MGQTAPKRSSPIEDPPAFSTFEEQQKEEGSPIEDPPAFCSFEEQQKEDGDEEDVEEEEDDVKEEEDDDEDEEGEDDKRSSGKKPVQILKDGGGSGTDLPVSHSKTSKSTALPVKRPIESDNQYDNKDSKNKKNKSVIEEDDISEDDTEKKKKKKKKKKKPKQQQLFQRVWTEDDELAVLKGMLDYYSNKGKVLDPVAVADINAFHDFIKKSLHFDVSRTQLYDKIRRLKKKYMNNTARAREGMDPYFSKPHEHKSFLLSKKIWGSHAANHAVNDNSAKTAAVQLLSSDVSKGAVKEEEQNDGSSLYPHLAESFKASIMSMPRMEDSFVKQGFRLVSTSQLVQLEQQWCDLRNEEIGLFFKRMELMQKQTKLFQEAYIQSKKR